MPNAWKYFRSGGADCACCYVETLYTTTNLSKIPDGSGGFVNIVGQYFVPAGIKLDSNGNSQLTPGYEGIPFNTNHLDTVAKEYLNYCFKAGEYVGNVPDSFLLQNSHQEKGAELSIPFDINHANFFNCVQCSQSPYNRIKPQCGTRTVLKVRRCANLNVDNVAVDAPIEYYLDNAHITALYTVHHQLENVYSDVDTSTEGYTYLKRKLVETYPDSCNNNVPLTRNWTYQVISWSADVPDSSIVQSLPSFGEMIGTPLSQCDQCSFVTPPAPVTTPPPDPYPVTFATVRDGFFEGTVIPDNVTNGVPLQKKFSTLDTAQANHEHYSMEPPPFATSQEGTNIHIGCGTYLVSWDAQFLNSVGTTSLVNSYAGTTLQYGTTSHGSGRVWQYNPTAWFDDYQNSGFGDFNINLFLGTGNSFGSTVHQVTSGDGEFLTLLQTTTRQSPTPYSYGDGFNPRGYLTTYPNGAPITIGGATQVISIIRSQTTNVLLASSAWNTNGTFQHSETTSTATISFDANRRIKLKPGQKYMVKWKTTHESYKGAFRSYLRNLNTNAITQTGTWVIPFVTLTGRARSHKVTEFSFFWEWTCKCLLPHYNVVHKQYFDYMQCQGTQNGESYGIAMISVDEETDFEVQYQAEYGAGIHSTIMSYLENNDRLTALNPLLENMLPTSFPGAKCSMEVVCMKDDMVEVNQIGMALYTYRVNPAGRHMTEVNSQTQHLANFGYEQSSDVPPVMNQVSSNSDGNYIVLPEGQYLIRWTVPAKKSSIQTRLVFTSSDTPGSIVKSSVGTYVNSDWTKMWIDEFNGGCASAYQFMFPDDPQQLGYCDGIAYRPRYSARYQAFGHSVGAYAVTVPAGKEFYAQVQYLVRESGTWGLNLADLQEAEISMEVYRVGLRNPPRVIGSGLTEPCNVNFPLNNTVVTPPIPMS